jgi:hypothetical protein
MSRPRYRRRTLGPAPEPVSMRHIASGPADAFLCEAALACQAPPTHLVTWWVTEDGIRRKTANYICAGHAAVLSNAVRSGNAARYDHTPVVILRFRPGRRARCPRGRPVPLANGMTRAGRPRRRIRHGWNIWSLPASRSPGLRMPQGWGSGGPSLELAAHPQFSWPPGAKGQGRDLSPRRLRRHRPAGRMSCTAGGARVVVRAWGNSAVSAAGAVRGEAKIIRWISEVPPRASG